MIGINITATAHYVPSRVLTNDEIGTWVDTSDEWIIKRTGISRRHISEGENSSDLGIMVANELLKKTQLSPRDIDIIIVTTVTPDYMSPSTACIIQEAIGAENAFVFDVNAACTGFVYGFSVAHKYLQSGLYKNVMLIGAEVLSKYIDWTDRGTCILFADGAGGMMLSAKEGGIYAEKLHAKGSKTITVSHHDVVNPFSKGSRDIDYIKMGGREVFEFAVKSVSENIDDLLKQAGYNIEDIDYIIPHQANGRIIEGIAKKMKVNISKFYTNIENFGNTSSASIPIAIDEMIQRGILKPGHKIIMSGFGGGLTWGSVLIEF